MISDLIWGLLIPPGITFVWFLMSRGLATALGTSDSSNVKGWTKSGFWLLLAALYVVCLAMFIYKYFIRGV